MRLPLLDEAELNVSDEQRSLVAWMDAQHFEVTAAHYYSRASS